MVAGTAVLGSVMSIVDTTVVNVALHDLALDFGVSITKVHWVASGYLLALAISIPLAGWTSERFGAKRVWMTSVALFLAGSMLAGLSWSIESLIAFRILAFLPAAFLPRRAAPSKPPRRIATGLVSG
jgi:MFS family permease